MFIHGSCLYRLICKQMLTRKVNILIYINFKSVSVSYFVYAPSLSLCVSVPIERPVVRFTVDQFRQ